MRSASRLLVFATLVLGPLPAASAASRPDIVLVSVDTLRSDHLSSYGYDRNTSPVIDELLGRGVRFAFAHTVEPLTAPAFASMLTSLYPHEHGSTRNGLRVRPNLASFSRALSRRGYETAAFLGNWTLQDKVSGLAEHFDTWETILSRKRWFGLAKREATADDVLADGLEWLEGHLEAGSAKPFLLWVHLVEPHAPYRVQGEFLQQIGVRKGATVFSPRRRYDSEIAYVDHRIGGFLAAVEELAGERDRLTVFVSDHGESLGEHGYWGHGRHLYEATLSIPMGIVWPGRIEPRVETAPASLLDLAPTLIALAGLPVPEHFRGFDWSGVLLEGEPPPEDRVSLAEAHRSSVQPDENTERLRRRGLLEVARLAAGKKEIFRVVNQRRWLFDLAEDRAETASLVALKSQPSAELVAWLEQVKAGLEASDDLPPPSLSDEDIDALRALGYVD